MWRANRPRSNELPVAEARANLAAVFAGLPAGPSLARVEDIVLGPGGPPARLYVDGAPGAPIAAFLHGGGWTLGGLDTVDALCRELAVASGALVVSVNYRLAPEHPFPAATEDVERVLRWLAQQGDVLGGDPRRLAVAGESAGANLAAVAVNALSPELPIRAQLLVSPSVSAAAGRDLLALRYDDVVLSAAELEQFDAYYLPAGVDRRDPRVSPLEGPLPAAGVATLIVGAQCDPLRPHGEAYAEKLRAGGCEVVMLEVPGMVHGFFGLPAVFAGAREALAAAATFLRERLGACGVH
jgi:acetyl esterase